MLKTQGWNLGTQAWFPPDNVFSDFLHGCTSFASIWVCWRLAQPSGCLRGGGWGGKGYAYTGGCLKWACRTPALVLMEVGSALIKSNVLTEFSSLFIVSGGTAKLHRLLAEQKVTWHMGAAQGVGHWGAWRVTGFTRTVSAFVLHF